jgi:hypothetical protein
LVSIRFFSVGILQAKRLQCVEKKYLESHIEFKKQLIGSIFPEKFQFQDKKVRTADINPILHKRARFNSVNGKIKKGINLKKEDLSRCVHPIELFSKQSLTFLKKFGD